MSRASTARRIVATAAYSGGGAVGVLGGAVGFLWAQSLLARRRVGLPRGKPFVTDGRYFPDGTSRAAGLEAGPPGLESQAAGLGQPDPLRMVMLGDSGAAGLGAASPEDTPAARLATGLAAATGRPVDLVCLAIVGAQSSAMPEQVATALASFGSGPPHVAVLMIGANDVTHRVRPQVSVRYLDQAVRSLVEVGTGVVVACCPDLGTVQPVPNPLRAIGRWASRTLAAAQALATQQAGGRPVELGAILGPEFSADPGEYFSEDRFHPSSVGYRRAAEVILPELQLALVHAADAGANSEVVQQSTAGLGGPGENEYDVLGPGDASVGVR